MAEIIDLTVSPSPGIIEILSDQENACSSHHRRTLENKERRRKKEAGNKHGDGESTPHPSCVLQTLQPITSFITGEPGLFFFDEAPAPVAADDVPPLLPTESNEDGNGLLLPSHVAIIHDDGPIPIDVIPPPGLSSDQGCIEYIDCEDRKGPGLVRYFEVEGGEINQSRPSVFKCKNCGAEGDHRTYECPILICLTCGARDEHSTRSCPIGKTCYTCGMKGHINKTCPNRFSAYVASSDFHGDCDRCGSAGHKMNECPTLWRIYQYVKDEERIMLIQSREEKKLLAIGQGGEGYIGGEVWCYNCANMGHLGDDCDELPHPTAFPMENSAFSSHNVMSGPFYDPAAKPVFIKRRPSKIDWPRLPDNWNASALVDVGKRGKNKDKERLEKRFAEQEDESEDWFNDIRNVKSRGTDQQVPPSGQRGKVLKFRLFKSEDYEPSPLPPSSTTNGGGSNLLARISDPRGGKDRRRHDLGHERHQPLHQSDNSIRIRGAAANRRRQDGKYASSRQTDWVRDEDQWDRDRPGQRRSKRGHRPRYRGGYGE